MAETSYPVGRAATSGELAALHMDVRPDGHGLPEGRGSVAEGEALYDERCASCHGSFGEGEGRFPALAGGIGSLTDERPLKTVGSYWPYATTLFDYTRRAMPFGNARSLSVNETYALVAYMLYLNDLVGEEAVMDRKALLAVRLPNRDGFVKAPDVPDTPQARCFRNCKTAVRVHSVAGALDAADDRDLGVKDKP